MRQYQLTFIFVAVSSVIFGVASFMINRVTQELAVVAILAAVFTGLVAFIVAADVIIMGSNRRRMEREIEAANIAHLQESRRRIVAAGEELRKEIALQLHGSVQNRLILLMHRLDELEREASSGEMAAQLWNLRREFGEVLQKDLHSITYQLYPSILRYGLVPALQSLGDSFGETLTIDIELDEELVRREKTDRTLIPEQVRLVAYRIAEEALGNVVKHANASKVAIRPELTPEGCLRLTVRDDGQGFDEHGISVGTGMSAMMDYAEAMGGTRLVHSAPGSGTEVIVTLPLPAPASEPPK